MSQLQKAFNYRGANVRTVVNDNDIWFVAKDVCEVLELSNPTVAIGRLDEDEVTKFNLGRQGETNFVNEPGLYSLILGSRKPEAKQFKRWITHEVIPSIRKTGSYSSPNAPRVLTEKEQLMASMRLSLETAEEVESIKGEVKEIKDMVENQITLDHGEQRRIQRAVSARIYTFTNCAEERSKLFRELYREIKDRFGVASYKDIKRKEMQDAIRYIEAWIPRRAA